jgi:hypothetical protein
MNITPHTTNLPIATVINPPTEGLRRENHQREIITQVTAANPSVAEKGVASDKERARTPAQVNEQVDFANLRKQAEQSSSTVSDQKNQQGDQHQGNQQQGNQQQGNQQQGNQQQGEQGAKAKNEAPATSTPDSEATKSKDKEDFSKASTEQQIINQLQQRDQEVRAHELAHASTGGAATGSPSYTFEVGPDGKNYAVGGEVSVDLSSVSGDPQATISKMQKVHAAALAPANPSSQDTRVAASAAQIILTAQSELLAQKNEQNNPQGNVTATSSARLNNERVNTENNEFDTLINQTLANQDESTSLSSNPASSHFNDQEQPYIHNPPTQSNEVQQRSQRIENYYFNVSQGYEKPDNFQFKLIA